MVWLVREIQDLCQAVFHVKHPDHDTQNAQHAWLPIQPQSCKVGHISSSPKAGDLFGRLRIMVYVSAALAQPSGPVNMGSASLGLSASDHVSQLSQRTGSA